MTPHSFLVRRVIGRLTRLTRAGAYRRLLVPGAALLGLAAGGAYGLLATPQYAATSYVVVVPAKGSDPAGALGLAQAYGRVATDVAVTADAQVEAGVPAGTLRAGVQAATSPDAPMISLTARAPRPETAVAMADSVARALVQKGAHTQDSTGVRVVQFTRAATPTAPVSPSAPLSALVGGCAGGLLGGLALLVRPRRDTARGRYAAVPGPGSPSVAQPEAV
ncbi:lipopolysaccharide biosynthesis protein [Streptomyces ficellus]|uniref:Lipopolysaccharide biosynthesis protein n=1 Tax=Streptomyces ficellus TaxID=1977088 RepID=A0ABT7Z9G2_9ACTN|nr:lipopolysaccharide biosynthesis protein [Streptomyces ficellus]MDN3296137.1 lipopolysaccharide biosynthesis protein [Streptomyces ficellus]